MKEQDKFYYKYTPKARAEKVKKKQQNKNIIWEDFEDEDDDLEDYAPRAGGKKVVPVEVTMTQAEIKSCPHYKKCNGCQLQNLDYPSQIRFKQKSLRDKIGNLAKVNPIITMEDPTHYRNKASCAFSTDRYNKPLHGVFQSKTKHVVKVKNCMVQDKISNKIIESVAKIVYDFKLQPYNSMKDRGFFRHVLVRRSFTTGEVMVVLVTKSPIFANGNSFAKALLKRHPDITTIVHCINDSEVDMLVGRTGKVLHGNGYIHDKLMGLTFKISPQSFYQINPVQTDKLYSKALELAKISKTDIVVDAYCGTGTIGMLASKDANVVIGIEQNAEAVRDAKSNARLNGIKNISFHCGDAGKTMVNMVEEGVNIDLLIMDPPRTGSDITFLDAISNAKPKKIVYISCNPNSLTRDLKKLTSFGYKVSPITPVDMFPYTNHIESVCLLTRG